MPKIDAVCSCGPKTVETFGFCPDCKEQYKIRFNTKHYERKN